MPSLRRLPVLIVASFVTCAVPLSPAFAQAEFVRGDINHDGRVSLSDAEEFTCLLFCAFWPAPCFDAADVDDDGTIDLVDFVRLFQGLFSDSNPFEIPAPFPAPGLDTTDDDLDCDEYEVTPSREFDDRVELGHVRAAPGSLVKIPVFVSSQASLRGVQLAFSYDRDVFRPADLESLEEDVRLRLTFEGSVVDPEDLNVTLISDRDFPDESIFRVGVHFSFLAPFVVEPGENVHVMNVIGRISEGAEWGSVTVLDPVVRVAQDGTWGGTELAGESEARLPRVARAGSITVAEAFRRGDANVDGNIDISDAIDILDNLFLGGAVIDCRDSADTNDDASIDVSDGLNVLNFLFLGGDPPVTPYPDCGVDPTVDALDCVSYPPCSQADTA